MKTKLVDQISAKTGSVSRARVFDYHNCFFRLEHESLVTLRQKNLENFP